MGSRAFHLHETVCPDMICTSKTCSWVSGLFLDGKENGGAYISLLAVSSSEYANIWLNEVGTECRPCSEHHPFNFSAVCGKIEGGGRYFEDILEEETRARRKIFVAR